MTITFLSNYINHHQIPFSNACYALLGDDYHFVQTQPMEQERLSMGWNAEGERLSYVCCLYEEEKRALKLILESDVLLAGWSNREDLVQRRLNMGKLTIRVSERLYREGQWKAVSPKGLIHKYKEHTRYRKGPAYLLCAGAYVPSDFHIIRAYPGKMFKWGYFPETRYYTQEQYVQMKREDTGTVNLVWAGRFIPLKHPEYMIRLAKALKAKVQNDGMRQVHIHMAGGGEMEEELKALAKEYGVEDEITFYGFQTPEQVREIMERSHIHIFTSNHLEGWGAVVNEAMNSGCAVVANVQAGAIPYLIQHGKNGMVYPGGNYEKMEEAVCYLLTHPKERMEMGKEAYRTITDKWNARHAAKELLRVIEGLQEGRVEPAKEGPLSVAPVISPSKMYRWMTKGE
ncbi:GDP-mannose-dependent alpha-(1-6)-phosphatidylinositol monomannoside mannosyltransferase [Lachnospiraceae bacterium]|nr:GDP-mannose-dependent alpha-(1-6)-phosphatidylinositol monomannoside mannosyltransferase [Lachnospiraceae bacterium]